MPWFGSRLQDVVDFLLVVKERNMRERAKIVTREESDRRLRVFPWENVGLLLELGSGSP